MSWVLLLFHPGGKATQHQVPMSGHPPLIEGKALIKRHALWPLKAVEDSPKPCVPAPLHENERSSWLLAPAFNSSPALVVTSGVNQQTEHIPGYLFSSLYLTFQ